MADIAAVIDGIMSGDFDGQLALVVDAVRRRAEDRQDPLRWRITIGDDEWDEDSLTVGEMAVVELVARKPWAQIEPPYDSASSFAAYVVAHLHKVRGLSLDDAIKQAETLPVAEAIKAISKYEVVPAAPKDELPASTSS